MMSWHEVAAAVTPVVTAMPRLADGKSTPAIYWVPVTAAETAVLATATQVPERGSIFNLGMLSRMKRSVARNPR